MKYIVEYNLYDNLDNNEFKVIRWDFGDVDEESDYFKKHNKGDLDYFNVWVETPDGAEEKISVDYQLFLDHIKESIPNLKSYLSSIKFTDIKDVFDDLSSLGFDIDEQIQSWVDYNVTTDTIDATHSEHFDKSDLEEDDLEEDDLEEDDNEEGDLEY